MGKALVEVERKQGFCFGWKFGEGVPYIHVVTSAVRRGGGSGEGKKFGIREGLQERLASLFSGKVYGPTAGENTDEGLLA